MPVPRFVRSSIAALVAVCTLLLAVPVAGASHTSGPGPHIELASPTVGSRTDAPIVISGVAKANGSEYVVNFINVNAKDLTTGKSWNGTEWVVPNSNFPWRIPSTVTKVDANGDPAEVSFSATMPATGHRMWIVVRATSKFSNDTHVGLQLDNIGGGPVSGGGDGGGDTGPTSADSLAPGELILTKPSSAFGGGQLEIEGFAGESLSFINTTLRVQLTVKDLTTQNYWNGSSWQRSYATFDASTTKVGTTTANAKLLSFNATIPAPAHRFYVTARTISIRNSYSLPVVIQTSIGSSTGGQTGGGQTSGGSDAAIASSGGNGKPAVSVTSPSTLTHTGGTITISGTATDPNGVRRVEVTARNLTTRHYWNGARFAAPFGLDTATLANPGATSTAWSISIPTAAAGHYFGVRAIDRTGDYGPFAAFQTSVGGAGQPPAGAPPQGTVILTPSSSVHNGGNLLISGTAADPDGVKRVEVTVRDLVTKRYWNGSSFQTPFALTSATLSNPGETTTTWSVSVPTGRVPIYLAARLIDNRNNYLPFETAQTAPS